MKKYTPLFMAMSLALIAPASQAQTPDANVQKLIGQVATAYQSLTSFSTTLVSTQINGTAENKVTTKLNLKKPNLLSAEITSGDVISHEVADGTTIYFDSSKEAKKYLKQSDSTLKDAVNTLGQHQGAGVGLLPILLTSATIEKQIIPGKPTSLKLAADQKIENVNCDVMVAVVGNGQRTSRFEFDFGKEDHLLRRLTIGTAEDGAKPMVIETYTEVNTNPTFSDTTFKYTPAAGAVATDPPKEPDMYDPRIKAGAKPFPITGKDLAGNAVSLDQYKGKVLLLDFWATWCGPCVAELPNVLAVYGKYHPKGFEVLGISLDQANSKAKLESFIKEKQMPWKQVFDGKYWKADNAVAYGVQAIPFTVLIGRDGKIVAVGARGEDLAPAVEAALAAK